MLFRSPTAASDDDSGFTPQEEASFERGSTAYFQLCHVCHGPDGVGAPILDDPMGRRMAPSLSKSPRVLGRSEYAITALLAGVTGPVDDENYQGQMVSMASYGDAWVADVASFIRGSFDNDASMVTSNQVARIRKKIGGRTDAFTVEEIQSMLPVALTNQARWKATASHNPATAANAIDDVATTVWNSGVAQKEGTWFQIELPEPITLWDLNFDSSVGDGASAGLPRGYKVQVSLDGSKWSEPVAEGKGRGPFTMISLHPVQARFLRVTLTMSAPDAPAWAISRTQILRAGQPVPQNTRAPRGNAFE